ncbi:hypothetical protein HNQ63_001646 [Wenzhouxiangella marina]|uniref:Uncharacterized protein n=1 Tax=Wenzhouxiangella marina TaxID=1579979 RepID=A0A0K0XZU0_9GAMM|nr:hypothetical protein WM2015_2784 [Wenzhouxiangella marina]MBB6087174.1 hypothetical protein [Wenzhouxiangella marina]
MFGSSVASGGPGWLRSASGSPWPGTRESPRPKACHPHPPRGQSKPRRVGRPSAADGPCARLLRQCDGETLQWPLKALRTHAESIASNSTIEDHVDGTTNPCYAIEVLRSGPQAVPSKPRRVGRPHAADGPCARLLRQCDGETLQWPLKALRTHAESIASNSTIEDHVDGTTNPCYAIEVLRSVVRVGRSGVIGSLRPSGARAAGLRRGASGLRPIALRL